MFFEAHSVGLISHDSGFWKTAAILRLPLLAVEVAVAWRLVAGRSE